MAVMRAMRSHLTDDFLAMMSGLIHAMRGDRELADVLWSHLANDHTVALPTIWQRDADGRWRLAVDSSSPNPPTAPAGRLDHGR